MKIKHWGAAVLTLLAVSCGATAPAHSQPKPLPEACASLAPLYVLINEAHRQDVGEYTLVRGIMEEPELTDPGKKFALAVVRARYGVLNDERISNRDFAAVAFEYCLTYHATTY